MIAIDRFGRVVIPKQIRDALGLQSGTQLQVEEKERQVVLKPVAEKPQVVLNDGILVFTGDSAGDLASAVHVHREQRLHRMAGHGKK